jgi:hypothetical protein
MKRLILTLSGVFLLLTAKAQKFYIQPTPKKYETKVQEKLSYDGYSLVTSETEADYKIECLIETVSAFNGKYRGYIRVTNLKTGKEAGRTKEITRKATMFRGYNAADTIFGELSKKELITILKNCK